MKRLLYLTLLITSLGYANVPIGTIPITVENNAQNLPFDPGVNQTISAYLNHPRGFGVKYNKLTVVDGFILSARFYIPEDTRGLYLYATPLSGESGLYCYFRISQDTTYKIIWKTKHKFLCAAVSPIAKNSSL